ncbi:MAG: tetratricopeptide repeat protein [Phycisphaerales bacterium]|nr:tetratricopeptide repeat protein [Phycisphaerales bacterium]
MAALGVGRLLDRAYRHDRDHHYGYRWGRACLHGAYGYCGQCYSQYGSGYYGSYYRPGYLYTYPYFVPTYRYGYGSSGYVSYYPDAVTRYDYAPTYTDSAYSGPSQTYTNEPSAGYAPGAPANSGGAYAIPSQPQVQSETTTRQPDPMVLAAVGEGNSAFAAGRYGDARRAYVRAVLLDENDGTAKLLYGLATFAEGDFGVAATALRRALATTPDLIDYPFNIVALYGNGAGFNEQLSALARYIGANPEDREAILLLAYLRYASGEAAEAQVMFGALADADPTDSLVVFLRDAATRPMQAGQAQPTQSPLPEQPAAPPDEFVP